MLRWLFDAGLALLLMAGEAVAVAGWFLHGSFEVLQGRRRTTPAHRVALGLAGTAAVLAGVATGLYFLGLPVAATVQGLLAAATALLLLLGLGAGLGTGLGTGPAGSVTAIVLGGAAAGLLLLHPPASPVARGALATAAVPLLLLGLLGAP
ncbi:hypothetical protein GCM10009759_21110 [Kitasatospora saccharophila]|uniref:Uncharacterized protein n=1 Tax=Kitasatospora saccharophila TaxID=407973 RepID=A0ABN2WJQ1_9ACTN